MALNRTGARAIVTTSKIDGVNHADLAMNAAVEAFSIRHVCGFGDDLPEGMASLDQAIASPSTTTRAVTQDGRRAAMISFDVTAEGFRAVPRTPSQPDRRRPCGFSRKRRAAGHHHDVGIRAILVRRPCLLAGGLAAVGRNAGAAPSVRRRGTRAADQRRRLRYAGRAGATGVAAGRDRDGGAPADAAPCDRPLARAGTDRIECALDGRACRPHRRLPVRRSRAVRRSANGGRRAGGHPAGTAWRAPRRRGIVDRRRNPDHAAAARSACEDRW